MMTRKVLCCRAKHSLADVAATMIACKIDCLPVVEHKKILGIITTTDILHLYGKSSVAAYKFATVEKVSRAIADQKITA